MRGRPFGIPDASYTRLSLVSGRTRNRTFGTGELHDVACSVLADGGGSPLATILYGRTRFNSDDELVRIAQAMHP